MKSQAACCFLHTTAPLLLHGSRGSAGARVKQLPTHPLAPACQGVPPDMRRQVWLELSGAKARRARAPPHYYASAALQGHESPFAHQIELVGGMSRGVAQWVG